MALPAATARAAALCRIAACASASSAAAAATGGRRGAEKLPFSLAERGMVVGGHRGMGMNAVGAPPGARIEAVRERENTLLSFGRAAAHAAVAFVEFDVQVTKDGCPIIFHDDFILTQETDAVYAKRVTDLLLEEFLSYGPQKNSHEVIYSFFCWLLLCQVHGYECIFEMPFCKLALMLIVQISKPLLRRTSDGRVVNWSAKDDDSLCTLQEVFERVSPRLGFNIELKFDDDIFYERSQLDRALQAVLQVVSQYASNRPVFFSTFHPDAARIMRELQSLYPVLFLTEGGTAQHKDSRRNSLDEAIRVCLEYELHGLVSEVRGVLKNPSAVLRAKESNLALLTYGQLNNVWEAVYIQYLMGVNGVIVDLVEEISNAVADFSKPVLNQSMLGSGVDLVGAKHQAFSQQQLGFLLWLIPELIQQPH
ncbi:glycerophosphodiester phosphodiesterase GDPD1, chloroplastic isoform X1 [Oryza sativa Japonica Group]|uniref:glycerophosphodiester phosphodiesterase n=1 Tax=Oryza sativa subsp. japonica TaxID=39947 RepID=A0A0P0XIP2_ORYSJ|nr:glycerophosphodiester phosphodiesterase GDPD1, chloroplastic isoform X1 [Oryza sativa Japonica Group]BAT06439.1 Os08g0535700 [Oryza sativa Japonica Group]